MAFCWSITMVPNEWLQRKICGESTCLKWYTPSKTQIPWRLRSHHHFWHFHLRFSVSNHKLNRNLVSWKFKSTQCHLPPGKKALLMGWTPIVPSFYEGPYFNRAGGRGSGPNSHGGLVTSKSTDFSIGPIDRCLSPFPALQGQHSSAWSTCPRLATPLEKMGPLALASFLLKKKKTAPKLNKQGGYWCTLDFRGSFFLRNVGIF